MEGSHRYLSKMLMDSFNTTTRLAASVRYKQNKARRFVGGRCVSPLPNAIRPRFKCSRLLDLEVSKPQKNTRNAAPTPAGDSLRAGYNKRPRSPDYGRGPQRGGQRNGSDRFDRGVPPGGIRGDMRRRDDYRPMRSPSPRGFRGRDEYRGPRGRSPDRYYGGRRSRSRSPPYGRNGRYRSRSPLGRDLDEEASLPIPRRDIRDVPDVQLILVDQVDR